MNPKVKKLKAEREKNCEKISRLTARNEEIDEEVTKLENLDIIGLVRGVGMNPDQLAAILKGVPCQTPVSEPEDNEAPVSEPVETPHEQEGGYYGEG